MLINKVETCTASINELSTLRSNALSLTTFENAVNKLTNIEIMVAEFVSTVEELNKTDFCKVSFSPEDIEKLKEAITACAGSVNEMRLTSNDVAAISSVFKVQTNALSFLWKSKAKERVEPICSFLGMIQTIATNKDEISKLIRDLGTGSSSDPTAAIVKTLVENINKANVITSNFQMSESVRVFMQKVKIGKATYADITPDVSKWISEHNLANRIKISF